MHAAIQATPGKAPEEAAIGHNGDDGNAARRRLGVAGAAEDLRDTA
jgi:hypothetical protein